MYFRSFGIRAHPHDSKGFIMSVLLVIYATFCVVTGESLNNYEHLSNIGYIPGEAPNAVMGPDTGGSNIVEVRVLPDPDFIPPQNIKIDRKGSSLKDENVRTISRTVSRLSLIHI